MQCEADILFFLYISSFVLFIIHFKSICFLIKNKKNIPDEYEIIGFDNSPISMESILPITTVKQDIVKIAEDSMKLILRQINAKNKNMPITIEHINIDTELIQRETTS